MSLLQCHFFSCFNALFKESFNVASVQYHFFGCFNALLVRSSSCSLQVSLAVSMRCFFILEVLNTAPVQRQFFCCFRWLFRLTAFQRRSFMSLLFNAVSLFVSTRCFFLRARSFIVAPVEYRFFGCFKAILFFWSGAIQCRSCF